MARTKEEMRTMREKYHLGEYRKTARSAPRTRIKFTRRLNKMAKKRSRSRGKSIGGTNGLMGTMVGVGAYILFEALIEPKIVGAIGNGLLLNVAELAAGVYFARKGGFIGNTAKAAIVINSYQILQPYLASIGQNSSF